MKRPLAWLLAAYALLILILQPQGRSPYSLPGNALELRGEQLFARYTSKLTASVLGAMVLGSKNGLPPAVYSSMMRTGTVHILVVSGFNVGLVAFAATLLLKGLRVPRIPRIFASLVVLLFYCFLTGATTPVVRATVMGITFIGAYLFRREPDIWNSLSLAALFILAVNPNQLSNIGFQLSFASVAAIAFFYPRLARLSGVAGCKRKIWKIPAEGLLVSLAAWLGTAPLIAWHFRAFSPVTVLANLFIVPIATLITLCGFILLIPGPFLPGCARLFAGVSELLVLLLVWLNQLFLKLPFAYISF
jgi:competence protein ComEC